MANDENRRTALFSLLAVASGSFAALTIPDEPPGLAVALAAALVVACGLILAHGSHRKIDLLLVGAGVVCMSFFAIRTAPWLLALDLLAAGGLVAVGAARSETWAQIALAPFKAVWRLLPGLRLVARPMTGWLSERAGSRGGSAARAGLLAGFLTIVFGALFASADAAFASIAERLLVPDIQVGLVPARVIVGLVCCGLAGSFVLLSTANPAGANNAIWKLDGTKLPSFRLSPVEWITPLVVLDALFAVFVAVQLTVLFGGHEQVLQTTGLTYAEYARSGFFQLVLVAFLTLGVIATVVRLGTGGERLRFWMRLLLGLLCALTLVVLASALKRMNLYQEVYGFTNLRLVVDTIILWLGAVFVCLLVAGAVWKAAWLPRLSVGLAGVALISLNLLNPEALVAEQNIERFARGGRLDAHYLSTLSEDAVPALAALPVAPRTCVLTAIASRRERSGSIWSYNLGRARAADILSAYDPQTASRATGCPLGL